jgi:hypothetical protein
MYYAGSHAPKPSLLAAAAVLAHAGFCACTCFAALLLPSCWQVYHPNIDLEGNICLNILREDWKPVLSISSVVYGLQFLFLVGGQAAAAARTGLHAACCLQHLLAT